MYAPKVNIVTQQHGALCVCVCGQLLVFTLGRGSQLLPLAQQAAGGFK